MERKNDLPHLLRTSTSRMARARATGLGLRLGLGLVLSLILTASFARLVSFHTALLRTVRPRTTVSGSPTPVRPSVATTALTSARSPVVALRWRRLRAGRLPRLSGLALRIALGLIVALVLAFTFSRLVNFASVLQRLEHLNIPLAVLCGLVFLSAFVVRALRWRCIIGPQRVGVARVVTIYQVAQFVNWLLPIRGGELVKSLLLRRLDDIPISESLPTVAMDKTMDLLPAVALLALLPFMPFQLSRPLWALLLTVLLVLGCAAIFLGLAAWRRETALALLHWSVARLPGMLRGIEPFVMRFVDALLALVVRPRLLLTAVLFTAVAVCCDALFCMLAFAAVGAPVSFPLVLFGYTFFNLAFILPTPPGQIGSNELLGLLLFSGLLGINRSAVAAMFLFSHPWTALLMVTSGLLCLSGMGLSLRSTFALAQQTPEQPASATPSEQPASAILPEQSESATTPESEPALA